MTNQTVKSAAFVAGCLLAFAAVPSANAHASPPVAAPALLATSGAPASLGDAGNLALLHNIIEGRTYDWLQGTDPAFRDRRMRIECGPISDPEPQRHCLASLWQ